MGDCINQILEFYACNDTASEGNQESQIVKIWSLKALTRLMEGFKNENDYLRVKNCLILVINLFFNLESPDILCNKGRSSKCLSSLEKSSMCDSLRVVLFN
jgi:hypothetical protein